MSGLGTYPAGIGPAGFSALSTAVAASPATPMAALFDPSIRGFPFLDDLVAAVHPVDQEACIRLGVPLGSIRSDPTVGLDLARLRQASRKSLPTVAAAVAKSALAPLIASDDVLFIGAPMMPDWAGRAFFFVDYVNLRLDQRRQIPVRR